MSHCLLIYAEQAQGYLEALRRYDLPDLRALATEDVAEARARCTEYDILLGEPHLIKQILPDAKRLRWVQSNYVGVGPLLDASCRRDYILTHLGPLYGPVMSEYVFCYLLMHERRVWQRRQAQSEHRWDNTMTGSLQGKILGFLGAGAISARIAQTAKFFAMQTRGYTRASANCEFIDVYFHGDQLLQFVADLDYLVCALPDTPETKRMVDKKVLAAMPSRAVLINIGRGNVIDDEALVEALQAGTIAGAVLDVFREEPLPASHLFWTTPNLLMTFHTAAPGPNYHEEIVGVLVENYRRFVAGQPLLYRVDFERGY
jgi:phosphoglycerate dehydrogenase-like enzyme